MTPLAWIRIGIIVGALVGLGWVASRLIDYGEKTATTKIEAGNRAAGSAADAAERDVLACPPGKWDKEDEKCAP